MIGYVCVVFVYARVTADDFWMIWITVMVCLSKWIALVSSLLEGV